MIDLLANCAMMWLAATAAAIALVLGLSRGPRGITDRKRRVR